MSWQGSLGAREAAVHAFKITFISFFFKISSVLGIGNDNDQRLELLPELYFWFCKDLQDTDNCFQNWVVTEMASQVDLPNYLIPNLLLSLWVYSCISALGGLGLRNSLIMALRLALDQEVKDIQG